MKQFLSLFLSVLLFSCSSDSDESVKEVAIKINFTQNWDGTNIEKSDLINTQFTNKLGTKLSIDRLRYLMSKITLTDGAGEKIVFEGYKLVDISNSESLLHSLPKKITEGSYGLAITFGFDNDDNTDGVYTDLNSASWNVPLMLGGGYHFMQMDGKYLNDTNVTSNFNYHTIRAIDKTNPANLTPEDTSFSIDLGVVSVINDATIEIKMNLAGWFKTPNDWDLNELNTKLMPNFEAQKLMSENGKSGVFSLGEITQ